MISKILRNIFRNKFCFGWTSGIMTASLIITLELYQIQEFIGALIISYIGTKYVAFKYLP